MTQTRVTTVTTIEAKGYTALTARDLLEAAQQFPPESRVTVTQHSSQMDGESWTIRAVKTT